jgi:BolA family transcriptional regulator, general stress-responsive regulator
MGEVAERMESKLRAALSPSRLELRDDSARHAGHAHGGVETHFDLTIEAVRFAGLTRVARQRLVMGVLADELAGPVHALAIHATAPGEG